MKFGDGLLSVYLWFWAPSFINLLHNSEADTCRYSGNSRKVRFFNGSAWVWLLFMFLIFWNYFSFSIITEKVCAACIFEKFGSKMSTWLYLGALLCRFTIPLLLWSVQSSRPIQRFLLLVESKMWGYCTPHLVFMCRSIICCYALCSQSAIKPYIIESIDTDIWLVNWDDLWLIRIWIRMQGSFYSKRQGWCLPSDEIGLQSFGTHFTVFASVDGLLMHLSTF